MGPYRRHLRVLLGIAGGSLLLAASAAADEGFGPRTILESGRPLFVWLLRGYLVVTAGLVVHAWPEVREALPKVSRRHFALLLGIVVIALTLRLGVAQGSLLHENFHGHLYVADAINEPRYSRPFRFLKGKFGWGYTAFHGVGLSVLPRSPETVFLVNGVVGGLTCFLVFAVGAVLFGNTTVGLWGALVFACWPLQVRVAPTELFAPLVTAAMLLSFALALVSLRRRSPHLAAAAMFALAFAVQTRIVPLLFPGAVLLAPALLRGSGWTPWTRRDVARWGGLFVVLAGWHYPLMVWMALEEPLVGGKDILAGFTMAFTAANNLLFEPTLTPVWLPVLAGLGWLLALRRSTREALWLLGCFVVLHFVMLKFQASMLSRVRFQAVSLALVAPVAGYALARLVAQVPPKGRRVAMILGVALPLLSAGFSYDALTRPTNQDHAWSFLRRHGDRIPREATIVLLTPPEGSRIVREFPDYWFVFRGWRLQVTSVERVLAQGLPEDRAAILWRGPLFSIRDPATFGEQPDHVQPNPFSWELPMCCNSVQDAWTHPQFDALKERFVLEPLAEERFPNRPLDYHPYPGRTLTFGLYRLADRE